MEDRYMTYRVPKEQGPRIAVIGGGHGLSNMLRGLKQYTENISAIVTVADDGGGSGMLRQDLGMPPPGDIRNCLEALANTEPLMRELMQYRFKDGSLAGQSFGNLFLAALNGISDSFDAAVSRMSEVLAITGRVLPVTTADVQLEAEFENGATVVGESKIFYCKKNRAFWMMKLMYVSTAMVMPSAEYSRGVRQLVVISTVMVGTPKRFQSTPSRYWLPFTYEPGSLSRPVILSVYPSSR
jgi:uncharacterized cofD-like protein